MMTACLDAAGLQRCLEESSWGGADGHLSACARCREMCARITATHVLVNGWLMKLAPPDGVMPAGSEEALARLWAQLPLGGAGRARNPWPMVSSLILQSAVAAALMMTGVRASAPVSQPPLVTLIAPPISPVKPQPARTRPGGGAGNPAPAEPRAARAFVPKDFVAFPAVNNSRFAPDLSSSLASPGIEWAATGWSGGDTLAGIGGPGLSGSGPGGSGGGNRAGDGGLQKIYTAGNGISAPVLLSHVDPEYSDDARKAKLGGTVTLSIVVSPDGRPINILVSRSLGMGLDEKAIEAVKQWRFKPGMNHGMAVSVRAVVEVNFRLL